MKASQKVVMFVLLAMLAGLSSEALHAASLPVPKVEVVVKRTSDKKTNVLQTDETGLFSMDDTTNAEYEVYIVNMAAPAVKAFATNGKLRGKVMLVMDEPAPAKAQAPVKKAAPAVKKPATKTPVKTPAKKPCKIPYVCAD